MFLRVVLVLKRLSSQKVESVLEIRIDGFSKYNIAECYNDGSTSLKPQSDCADLARRFAPT